MDDQSTITTGHDPAIPVTGQRPEETDFCSVDEMREASCQAGWDIEYRQLQAGRLKARSSLAQVADVVFQNEAVNRRLEVFGETPHDCISLLVPSTHSSCWANGHTIDNTHIAIVQPGRELHVHTGKDLSIYSVILPVALLRTLGLHATLASKSACQGSLQSLELDAATSRTLRQVTASTMYDAPAGRWDSETAGVYVARIGKILTSAIQKRGGVRDENPKGPLQTISRARDFIDFNLDKPIAMGDVCSHAASSLSKLERIFRRELGLTPTQYILGRRLAVVNRELKQACPDETMVSTIAMNVGFRHLGRFAAAYRRQFGELPSETLYS